MSTPNPYQAPGAPVADAAAKTAVDPGHAGIGILLSVVLLVLIAPIIFISGLLSAAFGAKGNEQMIWFLAPMMFFGAVQFVYIVPIALWFRSRGKVHTAYGMWLGAGILFLLNSACFGILWLN